MLRLAARLLLLILFTVPVLPARALGSFDGEAGIFTWVADTNDYIDLGINTNSVGGYAEGWWDHGWGVRASLYRVAEDGVVTAPDEQIVIDITHRLLSPTDNTFLAAGLGWEQNRFGAEGSVSGLRLVGEGRLGVLGALYIYGAGGWAPNMGGLGLRKDLSSISVEAGAVIDPLPFLSLRAAWRYHITDYTGDITGTRAREVNYGLVFGGGIHW